MFSMYEEEEGALDGIDDLKDRIEFNQLVINFYSHTHKVSLAPNLAHLAAPRRRTRTPQASR